MMGETIGNWGELKFVGDWKMATDGTVAHLQWCDETGIHDALLPEWLIERLVEVLKRKS